MWCARIPVLGSAPTLSGIPTLLGAALQGGHFCSSTWQGRGKTGKFGFQGTGRGPWGSASSANRVGTAPESGRNAPPAGPGGGNTKNYISRHAAGHEARRLLQRMRTPPPAVPPVASRRQHRAGGRGPAAPRAAGELRGRGRGRALRHGAGRGAETPRPGPVRGWGPGALVHTETPQLHPEPTPCHVFEKLLYSSVLFLIISSL